MQIKKIITVTAATLVLAGAVVGAAVASSRHGGSATLNRSKHTVTERSVGSSPTDSDTVEQGDQTGPETPDTTEAPDSESGGETGTESDTESETDSDGPGGHEDPPGNVDHQFEGEE